MPAIIREQESTTSDLNWFLTLNGVKTDAYLVEYRIIDITQGLPGTQVFPTTIGNYEDVTSAPGKFATGSYYAYDNTNSQGYTPPVTASIGTHRIEWRWKRFITSPYQSSSEDFEILLATGDSLDTYITVQDIRDEGLLQADYSDAKVLSYIKTWQYFLDRECRQWFNERSLTLKLDGSGTYILFLGIPIIEIEYIRINGSTTNLDSNYYEVYNNNTYPDDRRNPRIKLINTVKRNIFDVASRNSNMNIFERGQKNQIVKGTFGFVEVDGSPPDLIKRALTKIVIEKLTAPIYSSTGGVTPPPIVGSIIEEWTDGHKVKYATAGGETQKKIYGLSGITSDPEVLDIIKLYRAPRGIVAPMGDSLGGYL